MFNLTQEQTDHERIEDSVVSAMETGNPARAREVLADNTELFKKECDAIRTTVHRDYGIRL